MPADDVEKVAALAREVENVQDGTVEVSHGSDRLHLNRVAVLKRLVQDTRAVNHLPAEEVVVHVAHKQRLGRECVRLHLDIGTGNFVNETRFAHIGEASDHDCARIGLDGGQAGQVLPGLLQVYRLDWIMHAHAILNEGIIPRPGSMCCRTYFSSPRVLLLCRRKLIHVILM